MVTILDLFCGAGGSSTGAKAAGAEIRAAANHWPVAIKSHQTNHPATDHWCVDLQKTHPKHFPKTDMLWISPTCTYHSTARGDKITHQAQLPLWEFMKNSEKEAAAKQSRSTMTEVIEFSAHHNYPIVIVENVTEVTHWEHFESWLGEMINLGYKYKFVYLNSQFFGAEQSRDRFYGVFWKGVDAPDLDFRPAAYCERCEHDVQAKQVWHPERYSGKYNRQYFYCCPECYRKVSPYTVGSETIIDWDLPMPLVKDRKKPLVDATLKRIEEGIVKFSGHSFVSPQRTTAIPINTTAPLSTIVASAAQHALAIPPFVLTHRQSYQIRDTSEPLGTVAAGGNHHFLVKPFIMRYYGKTVYKKISQPLPTVTNVEGHALIDPKEAVMESGFRMLSPEELKLAQGFPKDYILMGNQGEKVRQIGGAVTTNVAEWLVGQCMKVL